MNIDDPRRDPDLRRGDAAPESVGLPKIRERIPQIMNDRRETTAGKVLDPLAFNSQSRITKKEDFSDRHGLVQTRPYVSLINPVQQKHHCLRGLFRRIDAGFLLLGGEGIFFKDVTLDL